VARNHVKNNPRRTHDWRVRNPYHELLYFGVLNNYFLSPVSAVADRLKEEREIQKCNINRSRKIQSQSRRQDN